MTDKKHNLENMEELRQRAEKIILEKTSQLSKTNTNFSPEEFLQILHKLQVYEIELEMQNEELRRTQVELEIERTRYFKLYDLAPIGYCTIDEKGLIQENNLTMANMLNVSRQDLQKQAISHYIFPDDQDIYYLFFKRLFEMCTPQTCDIRMTKKDGTIFWAHLSATVADKNKDKQEYNITLSDVSIKKQSEIELQYLSMHDSLTGLFNRGYFVESLKKLEGGRQYPISILMADVDKLKIINDQYGHAEGDNLLKRVADLLTRSFRAEDVIARVGGDEFAIIMPNTSAVAAENALLRFQLMLEKENASKPKNPLELSCGISTTESKIPLIEVLRNADTIMYREKQNRYNASNQK